MGSCIDIRAEITSSCIDIDVRRVGDPLSFRSGRLGDSFNMSASRVGEPLSFRCGLVCTIGDEPYLKVPTESIWLIPDNNFSQDVVVYANVSWTIE